MDAKISIPWKKTPRLGNSISRGRPEALPEDQARCSDRGNDAELIRRIRRGDDPAFHELVDRHGERLFGLARSLLGSAEDAEDVVQETLTAALRGVGGFRGRASVKTWLTRILIKRIARLRRRRRVRRTVPFDQAADADNSNSDRRVGATTRADIRMDVAAVLTELSEEHRTVVLLREMHGMSYDEIAEALAVPRGTVESRLFRARQRLKELLSDYLP